MFSGIRSRLKSLRRGDEDARIERKAKSAAKSISRTASRDLLEWEEKNGYKNTRTHQPSNSSSTTFVERSRTRSFKQHSPASSTHKPPFAFPLTQPGSFDTSPQIDVAPSTMQHAAPQLQLNDDTISASLLPHSEDDPVVKPLQRPASTFDVRLEQPEQPDQEERQRRITLQMEVDEKEKLLKEIQLIRQSIADLKTNPAQQQQQQQQLPQLDTKRLGSRSTGSNTPATGTSLRKSAPWMTNDRMSPSTSRPQSMFADSPTLETSGLRLTQTRSGTMKATDRDRRKSIADIFAEDSPRPALGMQRASSSHSRSELPRLQLPEDIVASGSSVTPEDKAASAHHRRNTSSGASSNFRPRSQVRMVDEVPPVPALPQGYEGSSPMASSPTKVQTTTLDRRGTRSPVTAMPSVGPAVPKVRQVVDTPEEARRRYSAALGRSRTPPAPNPKRRSTMGPGVEESTHRGEPLGASTMTLAELQQRHLAKLKQMQSPTSEKLMEQEALSLAKAEWERRTRLERLDQQRKAKERAEAQLRQEQQRQHQQHRRPSLATDQSKDRRRTLSEDMLKSYRSNDPSTSNAQPEEDGDGPPSPLMTAKRLNGAQKAREWRQSLASLSEERRMQVLNNGITDGDAGRASHDAAPVDEFGHGRTRSKSTLGLSRPAGVAQTYAYSHVPSPMPGQGGPAMMQPFTGHWPAFAPPPMAMWSPVPGPTSFVGYPMQGDASPGGSLVMGRSHSASPGVHGSPLMEGPGSYFVPQACASYGKQGASPTGQSRSQRNSPGAGSGVESGGSSPGGIGLPKHRRQWTSTDLRRLHEGAGPGRRPRSVVLNHEASRMSQKVD